MQAGSIVDSPRSAAAKGSSRQLGNGAVAEDSPEGDESALHHVVLESTTTETWEVLPLDLFELIPTFEK